MTGTIEMTRRAFSSGLAFAVLPGASNDAQLDVTRHKLVFEDTFQKLSVSAVGPGTTWIAHTPWNGDFGDAAFANPAPGFPFTNDGGSLRIEAKKQDGKWQSGLLASVDSAGNGFKQIYGYFEISAKLPPGPGVWPAFWLNAQPPKDAKDPFIEIDIFEYYGKFPDEFFSHVTVWPKTPETKQRSAMGITPVPRDSLSEAFHRYGAMVDPEWVTIYFDRRAVWRSPTPPEHRYGLMMLVNLALGSGWPINETLNPSYMYVEYVRAYALPS